MAAATPVREELFARDDDGTQYLIGGHCGVCERDHFPRATTCPYCGLGEAEEVRLPATGRLWGWTAVHNAPPGYRGEVPFGFGVVELDGGLRVITRLAEPDPKRHAFGQPMQLALAPLHVDDDGNQVETYTFVAR
jgi:uncharacterized protein